MNKIFIFGHKKPDTDSVCAAITLSYLKNKLGLECEPRILGEINNETKFVLNKFKVPVPEELDNVKLQIKDLQYLKNYYNNEKDSILDGFKNMTKHNISTTLIVNDKKKFIGIVGMKDIAKDQISGSVNKLSANYNNIIETIEGKEILKFDEEINGNLMSASYKSTRIIESIAMNNKTILIVGDRHSIIEYAIKKKIKLIILTGNSIIKEEHLKQAKINKINIIQTEFDTFKVNRIINLSNHLSSIIRNTSVTSMSEDDFVTDFVDHANMTKFSYYPVVTSKNKCSGILRLSDLGEKDRKKVILVDHNSYSQSVDGLDEAEIIEIIDHHNIGAIGTNSPINFRNMPVGSTNTIIYLLYKENNVELPKDMAGLILSGILSDTLILKSPTTTKIDLDIVDDLAKMLELDINKYGMEMFNAGTSLKGRTIEEIVHTDIKIFPVNERKIAISQIFTTNIEEIKKSEQKYIDYIEQLTENNNYLLCTLVVTDIVNHGSYIFYSSGCESVIKEAFKKETIYQGYYLDKVVSRKKQILPSILKSMQ